MKPIPDKAEVALEYPDKLYIGSFESSSHYEVHWDETGVAVALHQAGGGDTHKTVRIHFRFGLMAEILAELASSAGKMPEPADAKEHLLSAAKSFYRAVEALADDRAAAPSKDGEALSAEDAVSLLHVLE